MGLVLMVGHTFLYSAPVRKIVEIIQAGDIGEIRYINSRRLNLGLFQKDINVAWDLAPHDISIILHILGEFRSWSTARAMLTSPQALRTSQISRSPSGTSDLPRFRAVGSSRGKFGK